MRRQHCIFRGLPEVDLPRVAVQAWSARHLFPLWVKEGTRDEMVDRLEQRGIGVVVNYRAVHLLSFYATEFGYKPGDLPVAESIGNRTLSLPLYPQMTDAQVDRVIDTVIDTLELLDGAGERTPQCAPALEQCRS